MAMAIGIKTASHLMAATSWNGRVNIERWGLWQLAAGLAGVNSVVQGGVAPWSPGERFRLVCMYYGSRNGVMIHPRNEARF